MVPRAASCRMRDDVRRPSYCKQLAGWSATTSPSWVALDHHANITRANGEVRQRARRPRKRNRNDPPATGRKAARILFRTLRRRNSTDDRLAEDTDDITPQDQFLTSAGPMKRMVRSRPPVGTARRRPRCLALSDAAMARCRRRRLGPSSVHTDNDPELARAIAAEMANKAWSLRERFWLSERVTPTEAVRHAVAAENGLIILSDTGDSVYGGAPGDSTCILRALLDRQITCNAFVPMVDAAALRAAVACGSRCSDHDRSRREDRQRL